MHARSLLIVLVLLAGCTISRTTPPQEEVRKITAVHIVAMEAPPLGVPLEFRNILPREVMYLASPFLIYNTIAVLIEMPAAQRRGREVSRSIQIALETEGAWVPTLALADEVRAQLGARGIVATVAPQIKPIPGIQDRGYTLSMENWLAPIRAWYNDIKPVASYTGFPSGQPLYILELGVANYEIVENNLLVSVMIKMIDPADGRLVGRAYAHVDLARMPRVGPLDHAFGADAKPFKEIVNAEGRILVKECLTQLGFLE